MCQNPLHSSKSCPFSTISPAPDQLQEKQDFDFLKLFFNVRYRLPRLSLTLATHTVLIKLEKDVVGPFTSDKSDG